LHRRAGDDVGQPETIRDLAQIDQAPHPTIAGRH
jgi:hypothetical protein